MSFNIGLSGLRAATKDLDVTGNNIANAGTVGFKQSRAEFADVYAATVLGTGKNQQGSGVLLSSVSQLFNQGNINYTMNPLDLAINGNGFFQVSNNGAISYTRAGFFGTDKEGFIVDNFGYNLQGYGVDASNQIMNGHVVNLQIKSATQEPKATTEIKQTINLNSTLNEPTLRTSAYDGVLQSAFNVAYNNALTSPDGDAAYDARIGELADDVRTEFLEEKGQEAYDNFLAGNPGDEAGAEADRQAAMIDPTNMTDADTARNDAYNNPTAQMEAEAEQARKDYATTVGNAERADPDNIALANAAAAASFRPSDPNSYNSSTATDIYDGQGNAHAMSQYFVKTGPNSWDMHILIDGAHPHAGAANLAVKNSLAAGGDENAVRAAALAGLPVGPGDSLYDVISGIDETVYDTPEKMAAEIARLGTVTPVTVGVSFNSAGKLESFDVSSAGDYFAINPEGTLQLKPGMWTPSLMSNDKLPIAQANHAAMGPTGIEIDLCGASQYASAFAVTSLAQDGYTTGELSGVEIDDTGIIFARYTNGQSKVQGQVILADFANQQGLKPVGKTQWVQTLESGEPVRNPGRTGTLGAIEAGALEDSNVELSDQLVNLIVAQRNYQANAKTIETNSAITQTIINIR